MASNATAAAVTEAHRRLQVAIKAEATRLSLDVWPLLDPSRPDATFGAWAEANATIIDLAAIESVRAAADYFVTYSAAETGARYNPPQFPSVSRDRIFGTMLKVGPDRIGELLKSGQTLLRAARTAQVEASGATAMLAMDPQRQGLADATAADYGSNPAPKGWARVTSSKPCAFCAFVASRGPVYRSEASASFRPHKHCGCTVEPVYSRTADWPGKGREFKQIYDDAIKQGRQDGDLIRGTDNDYLNAFRRRFNSLDRQGVDGPGPRVTGEALSPTQRAIRNTDLSPQERLAAFRERLAELEG